MVPKKGTSLTISLLVNQNAVSNSKVKRILSPGNQIGDTAMMTSGRAVTSVCTVDRDKTNLDGFCWTKVGGSRKTTYLMTMYMLHNKENVDIKKQTVWDQHKMYSTSKGMVDKEPCMILFEDIVEKLLLWKQAHCEIVLTGARSYASQ